MTGNIKLITDATFDKGITNIKLELKPWQTKFIVIGQKPSGL